MKDKMKDKKGMVMTDMLIWLLMAVGLIVVVFVLYGLMTGKTTSMIEMIKNFRFWK